MLITNTEIYFLYEGLNKLRGLEINFPVRVGFNIVKNIKAKKELADLQYKSLTVKLYLDDLQKFLEE